MKEYSLFITDIEKNIDIEDLVDEFFLFYVAGIATCVTRSLEIIFLIKNDTKNFQCWRVH